jgi:uncharacterized 2Fe-2S/4Fe-4S cluster protein (DUF4445 family)
MSTTVTINGQTLTAAPGDSLFDCAQNVGVLVPTSCVRQGKCRECLVEVVAGAELLCEPTAPESHLAAPFRLSCQARLEGQPGEVECHTMRRGRLRIERHAPQLAGLRDRLTLDPAVTRDGSWVLLDGRPLVEAPGPIHGLALDLGTTTVVMRLFDLATGELLADAAFENPQRFGGSDVMSRIHYDGTHPGRLLRRTLLGYLKHEIEALPVDPQTIYECVLTGNSTMRDLCFGLDVSTIGLAPYQSQTELDMALGRRSTTALEAAAKSMQLPIHPQARVVGLPIISGHLGADAAACMLAINLAEEDRLVALMDIGTNTELIVGDRRRILAASCPAGPAFEGGGIACGMPALAGAVESVRLEDDGTFHLGVVDDAMPTGLCGSGLVELTSELLRTGRIDHFGRLTDEPDPVRVDPAGRVTFSESDLNELAQAKGANVAGLQVVMSQAQRDFEDVEVFYLAGGFGGRLNVEAARRIGLIPDLPAERFRSVGNAAIEGASIALLSRSRRSTLETLVRRVEHCRLETHPQFFDYFVDGCQFKPVTTCAAEPL